MTRSAASLEIVEPSNSDTPTAPTGAIPDMMLRYFCRNFIRFSIMEPKLGMISDTSAPNPVAL